MNFTPVGYLFLFISADVIAHIVTKTNRYAQQFIKSQTLKENSRVHKWKPVARKEMLLFLGLLLLMGIIKKPEIAQYWSSHPLLSTSLFGCVIIRDRWQLILKFLHFTDNENAPSPIDPNRDRLYKIRILLNKLMFNFQTVYTPAINMCIDEELVMYKGQLFFKQYLPL